MKKSLKTSKFGTYLGVLLVILIGASGCQNGQREDAENEIYSIILQQQEAWNQGDIDGFMAAYWNSDSLLFVSGDRVGYGWQKTLENYKRNYPTQEIMGTLDFNILKFEMLSSESCFVLGSWDLERPSGPIGGKFTLIWKYIDGKWVIVADHTS
jgi:ketosteroid isomerase-like protein